MHEKTSSSTRPPESDLSSFFAPFPTPAKKEPDVTVRSMSIRSETELSSRSSGITALPRWDSSLHSSRPKIPLPFPVRIHSSHGRKSSKHSQAPILEDDAADKEAGSQRGLASLGVKRTGSNRSEPKSPQISGSYGLDNGRQRHSRNLVWLVAVVVVVLALAIILGAVLGTFVKPGPSNPTPQITEIPAGMVPTPTGTTQPTPLPTGTKVPRPENQLASIAVTGWKVPGAQGHNSIWLFWQNREGYLSRATYDSSTGNWTRVTNFVKAKEDTPIAAAAVNLSYYAGQDAYSFPAGNYQTSVVYLDDKNYLSEWTFTDNGSELGQAGSLNSQKEIAHEDTRLGFYWPQIVYQGMSGEIRTEYFECHRKDQCWHERVLDTGVPTNGTPLVTSPSGNNLSSTALFYQAEDGHFVYYTENSEQESQLWQNEAFSNLIPKDASIASFSTARSDSPNDEALNTYLLWQDVDGTIQMSWTDSDDGWKGPVSHPAFAGADNNTALTCLTGLTFTDVPLQPGTELSRCYFQTGLALREVSFDGEAWGIVGVVPIDY